MGVLVLCALLLSGEFLTACCRRCSALHEDVRGKFKKKGVRGVWVVEIFPFVPLCSRLHECACEAAACVFTRGAALANCSAG